MVVQSVLLVGAQTLPLALLGAVLRSTPRVEFLGHASDVYSLSKFVDGRAPDVTLAEWSPQSETGSSMMMELRSRSAHSQLVLVGPDPHPVELLLLRALGERATELGLLGWATSPFVPKRIVRKR